MTNTSKTDTGKTTALQRLRHAHEVSLPARSMTDRVITHPVFVVGCLIALVALSVGAVVFVLWGK